MMRMLRDFRAFIERGNLVELAVAFIMGVAFAAVVSSFTDTLLGAIGYLAGSSVSLDDLGVHRDGVIVVPYGRFLSAVVSFILVAFSLFLLVRAYMRWFTRQEAATTKPCEFCRTDVPVAATRCPSCTSQLASAA
jgi:large conductance mechanosensitive channel